MLRVIVIPAARADLTDAVAWYDAHAPHLVPHFREALRLVMRRISENPRQFPVAYRESRRALLRRFPYIVVFRETTDAAYVIAVFHTSSNPITWQRRS